MGKEVPISLRAYRSLGLSSQGDMLSTVWNDVIQLHWDVWEYLSIDRGNIYVRSAKDNIVLSNILPCHLPPLQKTLPLFGRLLLKYSVFANILARKKGSEEVTLYAIKGIPQGQKKLDRLVDWIVIRIASPPLSWRREMLVQLSREFIFKLLQAGIKKIILYDLGAGGGFDGLDIARILNDVEKKFQYRGYPYHQPMLKIINIDIDKKWLENNEKVQKTSAIKGLKIENKALDIIEYLRSSLFKYDIDGYEHGLILCNGFADFFDDAKLEALFQGLNRLITGLPGIVRFIFPIARNNRRQLFMGRLIGFEYYGRNVEKIEMLFSRHFTFSASAYKQVFKGYGQFVFSLTKS